MHHHLIRERTRTRAGLVVEAGDARECHHIALLIGYGAAAVCPYLAIETVEDLVRTGALTRITTRKAAANLIKALGKGLLKIMSKMGVSTVASYTGAQIFEAIGLGAEVIDECFAGTSSRLGGVGFDELADETAARHARAFPPRDAGPRTGGWTSAASTSGGARASRTCSARRPCSSCSTPPAAGGRRSSPSTPTLVDDQSARLMTLRGLLRIRGVDASRRPRPPVPIDEVEPVSEIVRRFATGAMSYGSISAEAHQTLAIAMNRLGGRSNTGEGGEDPDRYAPTPTATCAARRSSRWPAAGSA